MSLPELRVGLLGFGQVGQGAVSVLSSFARDVDARLGRSVRVVRALVRTPEKTGRAAPGVVELTTEAERIVEADDVDLVIEVMGGVEPARSLVLRALARGKTVVTANKALLAAHGPELFERAREAGVDLLFEGAVCGGVPVVRTLREALAADHVESLRGIVNGTTNFILSAMESGGDYGQALSKAQALGFAEADPSFDVSGRDAAQKLVLLAALAFGTRARLEEVPCEGIEQVEPVDIAYARELGSAVKLIARARLTSLGLELSVRPTLVPLGSTLASVGGPFNAVEVLSTALGSTLLVGQGAGGRPTGAAVAGDVLEAARNLAKGAAGRVPGLGWQEGVEVPPLAPAGERIGAWFLRFSVADQPGVLAQIAGALGARGISIAAVIQRERSSGAEAVSVVVVTHDALERRVREAVASLDQLDFVRGRTRLFPIEP
jgi:homoserine dehydrogenase